MVERGSRLVVVLGVAGWPGDSAVATGDGAVGTLSNDCGMPVPDRRIRRCIRQVARLGGAARRGFDRCVGVDQATGAAPAPSVSSAWAEAAAVQAAGVDGLHGPVVAGGPAGRSYGHSRQR